jgi:hypothetical protein
MPRAIPSSDKTKAPKAVSKKASPRKILKKASAGPSRLDALPAHVDDNVGGN